MKKQENFRKANFRSFLKQEFNTPWSLRFSFLVRLRTHWPIKTCEAHATRNNSDVLSITLRQGFATISTYPSCQCDYNTVHFPYHGLTHEQLIEKIICTLDQWDIWGYINWEGYDKANKLYQRFGDSGKGMKYNPLCGY